MQPLDPKMQKIDEFVQSCPKGHFMQSPQWGQFKDAWHNEFVTVEDADGNLKGSMSLLIRKTPFLGYSMMYSPRGPVCDIHDRETIRELIGKASQVAKQHRCYTLKIDPDVSIEDKEFSDIFRDLGFSINSDIKGFDGIQPHFVFRLNIEGKSEEEILAGFGKKHRKNVRRAIKYGVTVRVGSREELSKFWELVHETGERQHFGIRSLAYFERMYDLLAPDHLRYLILEYEGEMIAGCLGVQYGDKVWCLYSATSDHHRDKKATYLMRWNLILWAKEKGCRIFDLMGVPGIVPETHPLYGLYSVKKGFGGDLIEFAGELDLIFHPVVYSLIEHGIEIRHKLRQLLHGSKKPSSSSQEGEKSEETSSEQEPS